MRENKTIGEISVNLAEHIDVRNFQKTMTIKKPPDTQNESATGIEETKNASNM